MLRKTLKRTKFIGGNQLIGGNISNTSGLQHIVSIGYEMECNNFMKLTRIDSETLVLFNSDMTLNNPYFEEDDKEGIARSQEIIDMDVIDDNGTPDENASFSITNDIAMYPFSKKLMKSCYYPSQDIQSSSKRTSHKDHTKEKNELYIFRDTTTNQDYKIEFLFQSDRECYEHSNVEWIFTYYKPRRRINVVVNTFVNMIQNLIRHVKDLTPIKGNFIFKYKDADDKAQELIIDKPTERTLYHKPETNLYYLLNQAVDNQFTIDDVCIKIQMTFGAKPEHIFTILETLFNNKKASIPTLSEKLKNRLDNIRRIKKCVDTLFDEYNKISEHKLVESRRSDPSVDILKNLLFLILYKIDRYYYYKSSGKDGNKYFKDVLAVNCRHINALLYDELKTHIKQILSVDNTTAVSIIKAIILQPKPMNLMVGTMKEQLRKGVFLSSNTLDKKNNHYGDPMYSLCSYFDFFEDPINNTLASVSESSTVEPAIYDWLVYKNIDVFSSRQDIKDGVILIECRNFQEMISMYAYSIADNELKEQMKKGACNIITKKYSEDVPALTIANFKKIIEILKKKKSSKTQKKTGSKS
jgi:hypothetical protein